MGYARLKSEDSDSFSEILLVRFTMYFCSDFMEISNVAHFWKAYGTRNTKIYVYICVDARMTAILEF